MSTTTGGDAAEEDHRTQTEDRVITRMVGAETHYHVGFGQFRPDREAALRYAFHSRMLRGETSEAA